MRPDGGKDDAHSAGGAALTAFLIFDVGPVRAVEGPGVRLSVSARAMFMKIASIIL